MASSGTRIHGPAQVSTAATTKYTVPAATKAILRQVLIQNPSASPVLFTLSIGADAAAVRLFDGFSIPALSVYDRWLYVPVEAAEVIQAFAGTNNILVLTLTADLKTLG